MQNCYMGILYDMLSYDKKYNEYYVAKKAGTEDADSSEQIRLACLRRNLSIT